MVSVVGRVVKGNEDHIVLRANENTSPELGEIIYFNDGNSILLYQIYSIEHSTYIGSKDVEMIAYRLDAYSNTVVEDKDQNIYFLVYAKPLVEVANGKFRSIKTLPPLFSKAYRINDDIANSISSLIGGGIDIGMLRSGNKYLNVPLPFDFVNAINHHILIGATTGRGKSNLMKVLLWKLMDNASLGMLIVDPHSEYATSKGLKEHERANENLYVFSPSKIDFINASSLSIDISLITPKHLTNVFDFSEPQQQAMMIAYSKQGSEWVETLLKDDSFYKDVLRPRGVKEDTYLVLRRKLLSYLNMSLNEDDEENVVLVENSIFSTKYGKGFLKSVVDLLESGKKVIIDTSELTTHEELLILSMISSAVFERYKAYKKNNVLGNYAKIGIVLEEAPRVLNTSMLGSENNIFGTIAREGRKFNIGFVAITQLPSLIPDDILANMNTKIILGMEMEKERNAVISSSPHDLSKDSSIIATLNKGEAIITSIFSPFPIPIYIYDFDKIVKHAVKEHIPHQKTTRSLTKDIEF